MPRSAKAMINPDVLAWAREDAGFDLETAAKKVQVKADRLRAWEAGSDRPTINQLRKLGRVYKRPIVVFYLSAPPKRFQAMHDYRRLPGGVPEAESHELRFEIRRARYRRSVALELVRELGESPPAFKGRCQLSDDPEESAARLSRILGMDNGHRAVCRTPYDTLNAWRDAVERQGVLVFQASGVEISEARGFSLAEPLLPVIVVNLKDSPRGRVFSMMHELVHIALRKAGLCDMSGVPLSAEERRIEAFCNHVAGAILVPRAQLLEDNTVREHEPEVRWSDDELKALSQKFQVSHETVLRRLLILARTTEEFYEEKRRLYLKMYQARQKGGFASPSIRVVSQAGKLFTRLVLDGYYQEVITSSSVADHLEVRLKHLPAIERMVLGHTAEFGAALDL